MIPPDTPPPPQNNSPGAFNALDPSHWTALFAHALGVTPSVANNATALAPHINGLLLQALGSSQAPAQGQGLAPQETYGGDDYAHLGWGTAQPFQYPQSGIGTAVHHSGGTAAPPPHAGWGLPWHFPYHLGGRY